MTRAGKVKLILLGLFALPGLIYTIPPRGEKLIYSILPGLLLGVLGIPFILFLNTVFFKAKIDKPSWNDSLFQKKKTLSWCQFFGFFFTTIGTCMIIKTAIKYKAISEVGIESFSFGIGILIGIYLTLQLFRSKITGRTSG